MLVDSFIFFNELDLLESRLEYLYKRVDRFIIVESNRTHTCNFKPLYFLENKSRYEKYLDKITHIVYNNNDPTPDPWFHESTQRNYIAKGLEDISDSAWVMISDLDEIPSLSAINAVIYRNDTSCYNLQQDMFFYNLNQKLTTSWSGTNIARNSQVKEKTPQWFRYHRDKHVKLSNGGWHLSYWGTPDTVRTKIQSFAHSELNKEEFTNLELITQRIKNGKDLYGREEIELVKVDRKTLPSDLLKYFEKCEVII